MATLMPITGEFDTIQRPKDEDEIMALLGLVLPPTMLVALDGSTWWSGSLLDPRTEVPTNLRATKFINAREYHRPIKSVRTQSIPRHKPYNITGKAICLSADETRKFFRWPEQMIPLFGETYLVKDKLKIMGARWLNTPRVWVIPESSLDDALDIMR